MKAEAKCGFLVLLVSSAAFDTLDHPTLLCDLYNLNITRFSLPWFKTYLTDRNFEVIVNDEESKKSGMKYGVPQGKISGPVLFIIPMLRALQDRVNRGLQRSGGATRNHRLAHGGGPMEHLQG